MAAQSRTTKSAIRRRVPKRRERPLDPVILKIAEKIAREYQPEKIILFGSHAWGTPGPDSDVDLLVVKESAKPRFERGLELNALFYPRYVPMDFLVYTPNELRDAIERKRNLFLEDVVRRGRTLYDAHSLR